ncbi:unnamed protein product [Linum tenue]|uniref:Cytochrome P450 n=1 Tax=Linum tenue TaxID=586396 RepID=A0AAV0LYC5_9ROSI|nr:unnamed protein product [Linum tenue]
MGYQVSTQKEEMEFKILSLPVLLPFLFFISILLRTWKQARSRSSRMLKRPPGPWKLPVIGNIHQLAGSSLPHRRLQDLGKRYGPLMHLQLGEVSNIIVSSAECARDILKTHDISFASRPYQLSADIVSYNMGDIVFAPYGNFWRQLRKVCVSEVLSSHRVRSFRSIREEEVSNLVRGIVGICGGARLSAAQAINLSKKIYGTTYSIVARIVFGKACDEQETFLPRCQEIIEALGGFSISDLFPSAKLLHRLSGTRTRLERLHREADKVLESILDEHRARALISPLVADDIGGNKEDSSADLVDVLLHLQQRDDLGFSLTTDNIKAVILNIFLAGSDTSSTTVEWAMSEMLKNPRVMEKAQSEVREVFGRKGKVDEGGLEELNYLKLVIKETLRLHPPAPLLVPRECQEECEIEGYTIPEKTKVIINAWAIGRDPRYWVQAEEFKPERFINSKLDYKGTNFEYIPFGAGRRICPGIIFATPNFELLLANLLFHFNWVLPGEANPELLDMTESFGATVRRKNDLQLVPRLWHPLPAE